MVDRPDGDENSRRAWSGRRINYSRVPAPGRRVLVGDRRGLEPATVLQRRHGDRHGDGWVPLHVVRARSLELHDRTVAIRRSRPTDAERPWCHRSAAHPFGLVRRDQASRAERPVHRCSSAPDRGASRGRTVGQTVRRRSPYQRRTVPSQPPRGRGCSTRLLDVGDRAAVGPGRAVRGTWWSRPVVSVLASVGRWCLPPPAHSPLPRRGSTFRRCPVRRVARTGWPVGRVLYAEAWRPSIYDDRCRPPPAIYPRTRAGRPRTCARPVQSTGLLDLAPGGVLPSRPGHPVAGGLLHHRFCLSRRNGSGGLFSVALSRGFAPGGCYHHLALWSLDLPPALSEGERRGRLASPSAGTG